MPTWLSDFGSSAALYLIAILAAIGLLWYSHHEGYNSGYAAYEKKQIIAQQKHDLEVKAKYAKIDKDTPTGANRDVAVKWLLSHTRSGN